MSVSSSCDRHAYWRVCLCPQAPLTGRRTTSRRRRGSAWWRTRRAPRWRRVRRRCRRRRRSCSSETGCQTTPALSMWTTWTSAGTDAASSNKAHCILKSISPAPATWTLWRILWLYRGNELLFYFATCCLIFVYSCIFLYLKTCYFVYCSDGFLKAQGN